MLFVCFIIQDSLSSYDSFNNPNQKQANPRIGPNAHDDLKTTLSKIEPGSPGPQSTPPKYSGNRWEQNNHRHDRLGSKLDLKYGMQGGNPGEGNVDSSPRNSREMEKDPMDGLGQRMSAERERQDQYRYGRSPGKGTPGKIHMETKTDYGKYR